MARRPASAAAGCCHRVKSQARLGLLLCGIDSSDHLMQPGEVFLRPKLSGDAAVSDVRGYFSFAAGGKYRSAQWS
jgi:hypothetical protein